MTAALWIVALVALTFGAQYWGHRLEQRRNVERDVLRRASDDHYLDRLERIGRQTTVYTVHGATTAEISREMQAAIDAARRALRGGSR